jgi:hypothetical protein
MLESEKEKPSYGGNITVLGGDDVVLLVDAPGSAWGNAIVYFEKAHVVATGDAFTSNGLPAYSKYSGGSMLGMNDVRVASKALDGIRDVIAAQIANGKTVPQMLEMKLLAPWKNLVEEENRPMFTKFYYDCLTGPPHPKFQL